MSRGNKEGVSPVAACSESNASLPVLAASWPDSARRVWVVMAASNLVQTKGLGALLRGARLVAIAASRAAACDLGEEALDQIEPGRAGRRDVQMTARCLASHVFTAAGGAMPESW